MPRRYLMVGVMESFANPAGHFFLAVAQWNGLGHKIEVERGWGYYGAPQSDPQSLVGKFKTYLQLGYDFTNSFGELKEEELRYLDVGKGLHVKVFSISDDQYQKLISIIQKRIHDQQEAIKEKTQELQNRNLKVNSKAIFKEELKRNEPRLKPFNITPSIGITGLTLDKSITCKSLIIELLREINIPSSELDLLTNNSKTIPRFSGKLEEVVLHSVGHINLHQSKRTGQLHFFRQWRNAKLYCSLPLQNIVGESSNVRTFFYVPEDVAQISRKYIYQLQEIDKIVSGTEIDSKYKNYKNAYLERLHEIIDLFAIVKIGKDYKEINDVANYFLSASYFVMCDPKTYFDDPENYVGILADEVKERICNAMGRTLVEDDYRSSVTPGYR